MTVKDLEGLYDYGYWANRKLFDVISHRGQVALLVRSLGHAPGNVDILFYYADRRGIPA